LTRRSLGSSVVNHDPASAGRLVSGGDIESSLKRGRGGSTKGPMGGGARWGPGAVQIRGGRVGENVSRTIGRVWEGEDGWGRVFGGHEVKAQERILRLGAYGLDSRGQCRGESVGVEGWPD